MHQCLRYVLFGVTLYMFRTVFPSIIRSSRLYVQQQAYVKQILLLLANGNEMELQFHLVPLYQAVAVSVWHTPVAVRTVLNSWWWTQTPSETCRVLLQIKQIWYIGESSWFYYRNISPDTFWGVSSPLCVEKTNSEVNISHEITTMVVWIYDGV